MTKNELIELMQFIFKEYNTKYFGDKIPTTGFCLFHKQRTLGTYFTNEHKIGLTDYYINGMSRHDVEEIMAHEMVHAYLHVTNNEDTGAHYHHGPRFYAMAAKVNRLSNGYLHISRCTPLSCGTEPTKRNTDKVVLLVCMDYSGRYCVGRIAETKVKQFTNGWLNRWFKVVVPYVATDGSKFAHLVKSHSRFNYKWYTKNEVETNVMPYVKLLHCVNTKHN